MSIHNFCSKKILGKVTCSHLSTVYLSSYQTKLSTIITNSKWLIQAQEKVMRAITHKYPLQEGLLTTQSSLFLYSCLEPVAKSCRRHMKEPPQFLTQHCWLWARRISLLHYLWTEIGHAASWTITLLELLCNKKTSVDQSLWFDSSLYKDNNGHNSQTMFCITLQQGRSQKEYCWVGLENNFSVFLYLFTLRWYFWWYFFWDIFLFG